MRGGGTPAKAANCPAFSKFLISGISAIIARASFSPTPLISVKSLNCSSNFELEKMIFPAAFSSFLICFSKNFISDLARCKTNLFKFFLVQG